MKWDPNCYNEFKIERYQPFEDLYSFIVPRKKMVVVDLGCGTGELTSILADRLEDCNVVGIDSSDDMLDKARKKMQPGLEFKKMKIEEVSGQWDLIFSNAAIQWVDNHPMLFKKLLSLLTPEGQMVIQIPTGHLAMELIKEVVQELPCRDLLKGWYYQSPVLTIDEYSEIIYRNGFKDFLIYEKVYSHGLKNSDDIVRWMEATALLPYLERLPAEEHKVMLQQYRETIIKKWPSGSVFFGFKRILISVSKKIKS